jgi:hypothetical protein
MRRGCREWLVTGTTRPAQTEELFRVVRFLGGGGVTPWIKALGIVVGGV